MATLILYLMPQEKSRGIFNFFIFLFSRIYTLLLRNFFVKWHENLVIFPKSFAIIQYILMYTLKGGALI